MKKFFQCWQISLRDSSSIEGDLNKEEEEEEEKEEEDDPVNVYYVLLWALGPTAFFTCIAHLYLYYTLLVPHTYASYIRH